jgi:hypothetical protein
VTAVASESGFLASSSSLEPDGSDPAPAKMVGSRSILAEA